MCLELERSSENCTKHWDQAGIIFYLECERKPQDFEAQKDVITNEIQTLSVKFCRRD